MIRTNVGTYSRQVGDVTVTALLDGQFEGTVSLILGPHEWFQLLAWIDR
jgi:hypothetical protein